MWTLFTPNSENCSNIWVFRRSYCAAHLQDASQSPANYFHGQQWAPSSPVWFEGRSHCSSMAAPGQWCLWGSRRKEAVPQLGPRSDDPVDKTCTELMNNLTKTYRNNGVHLFSIHDKKIIICCHLSTWIKWGTSPHIYSLMSLTELWT